MPGHRNAWTMHRLEVQLQDHRAFKHRKLFRSTQGKNSYEHEDAREAGDCLSLKSVVNRRVGSRCSSSRSSSSR